MLQPGHRVGVQVVGRFVQQQHVGSRQQQTAQRYAALFAAGQVLDLGIPRRQAQGVGGDFQLAFQVVSVGCLQDRLQLGLLGGQGVEVGIRLGIGGIDLVQPRLGLLDLADGLFDDVAHGGLRVQLGLLRQVADVDPRHRPGLAFDLGVDAGHDPQQGGLARAVQAEHADLGAGEERQGDVLEDFTLGRNDLADPMHGVDVLSQNEHLMKKGKLGQVYDRPRESWPATPVFVGRGALPADVRRPIPGRYGDAEQRTGRPYCLRYPRPVKGVLPERGGDHRPVRGLGGPGTARGHGAAAQDLTRSKAWGDPACYN